MVGQGALVPSDDPSRRRPQVGSLAESSLGRNSAPKQKMKSVVTVLAFVLVALLLILTPATAFGTGCSSRITTSERWGMPGGFSSPHEPSQEELSILQNAWNEAKSKCAQVPHNVNDVKVCSVSKQVVAGMNYAFDLEDSTGKTFKLVVYVPLPSSGLAMRVTQCELVQPRTQAS